MGFSIKDIAHHIKEEHSFALYRFPEENTIHLIEDKNPLKIDFSNINENTGFVIAPYSFDTADGLLLKAEKPQSFSLDQISTEPVVALDLKEISFRETTEKQYTHSVDHAISQIQNNELKKVVLSRVKFGEFESENILKAFVAGVNTYDGAFVCIHYTPTFGL